MRYFFSPGRLTIIGDHIDYNGGTLLAGALSLGTYGILAPRMDDEINASTLNLKNKKNIKSSDLSYKKEDNWINYIKGVFSSLKEKGCKVPGMDILVYGTLPHRCGLGSSSSLQVLSAMMLSRLDGFNISRQEIADMIAVTDRDYMNIPGGNMDPYVSSMARAGHFLLLDSMKLRHKHIPFSSNKYSFVLVNTNKKRNSVAEKFENRQKACAKSVRKFQTMYPTIKYLCELDMTRIESGLDILTDEERRYTVYAVSEAARVLDSVKLLRLNDLYMFGKKMYESHESLRDNYGVSCSELDLLVEESRRIKGILGARMTGAGFGGCVLCLLEKDFKEEYARKIGEIYMKKTGIKPDFYSVNLHDAAAEVEYSASAENFADGDAMIESESS